jgi:hypothetical protein
MDWPLGLALGVSASSPGQEWATYVSGLRYGTLMTGRSACPSLSG